MKKRGPKAYSEEYRREAVRLAETGTRPLAQIARELGIHLETLRGWRRQARVAGEATERSGFPPAVGPSLEEENRRLRRTGVSRNVRLRGRQENVAVCIKCHNSSGARFAVALKEKTAALFCW
jgi:transposase-like protein